MSDDSGPRGRPDRREAIIGAAFACMAREGYERTSTAQICRAAGVSSGTFFHYFPTKAAVLVAVLTQGLEHTRDEFARLRIAAELDATAAIMQWQEHVLSEAADEDLAGFIAVLGSVPHVPEVAAVLEEETRIRHEALSDMAHAGQQQGAMRRDLSPHRIATWLGIIADGVLTHAAEAGVFSPDEIRAEMSDVIARVLSAKSGAA